MKYFRSYPWAMQLLLFLLMVATFFFVGAGIVPAILIKISGISADQITNINANSPEAIINIRFLIAGLGNLFIFCIPALLFAYLSTPRPGDYLGLRSPGKNVQLLLAMLIMIGATPVLMMIEGLISHINFGADVKASQKANDDMLAAVVNIHSLSAFLKIFVLTALLPGFGEELFFRGSMMRFAKKRSNNMLFPILFSAAIFAYSHSNIYGYLSIFCAGIILAVIYNLTGSIWCSIVAHVSFNGLQLLVGYLGNNNPAVKAFMEQNTVPVSLVIGGAVLFTASGYLLWKNRTPLQPNWADDFTPEELSQKAY